MPGLQVMTGMVGVVALIFPPQYSLHQDCCGNLKDLNPLDEEFGGIHLGVEGALQNSSTWRHPTVLVGTPGNASVSPAKILGRMRLCGIRAVPSSL